MLTPAKAKLYRDAKIKRSRTDFWRYCKTLAPDFYKESRPYLKELCNTLQALWEKRIIRNIHGNWVISEKQVEGMEFCRNFMLNMPPQHGKSRTLILFCSWILGKNNNERIITGSYNNNTSSDFSRYTRDTIQVKKNVPEDIDYSDIFPNTSIKQGHGGFEKWALEGQHFNYLGVGVGGSVTSKGASVMILDDLIKGAVDALNINTLESTWLWYSGTFASRVSAEGGEALTIFNMTRWSKNDPCGKLLALKNSKKWFIYKRVIQDENGEMLCSELMSKAAFEDLKVTMPDFIVRANYFQEPIDLKGSLYPSFKTYSDIPRDINLKPMFEKVSAYIDTADEGTDYLCSIIYGLFQNNAYVIDVYYTDEDMIITEMEVARRFAAYNVKFADIESNNGGKGFATSVAKLLKEPFNVRDCQITWFHQSNNKLARILNNSALVLNNILMPLDWIDRFPLFSRHILDFKKDAKNSHDDAADALTGVVEKMGGFDFFAG